MKSARLTWNPSTAPDIALYKIYREASLLASVPHPITQYVDTTIPDSASVVSYALSAQDLSGNEGRQSPAINITFPVPVPVSNFTVSQALNSVKVSWKTNSYNKVSAPRTTANGVTTITITGV